MKVYGPYKCKDKRERCVIVHDDGKKQTVSYPKFIMERHLGRPLSNTEDVHHLDEDPSNNHIDNLVVVDKSEHIRQHQTIYRGSVSNCLLCGKEIFLTPKQESNRARESRRGTVGPFCSRQCSGKYGTNIQRSTCKGTYIVNVAKFGESLPMVTPSQAEQSEGVETRWQPSRTDEGIVQTTKPKG